MAKKEEVSQEELDDMLEEAENEAKEKDSEGNIVLEEKVKELEDQLLRLQAEQVNFRQRMEKEKIDSIKYSAKNTILDLLPVLDTFKLAVKHTPEELLGDNWVVGIQHIEKQFESSLESIGVTKIKTVGEKINYDMHEPVSEVSGEKDIIVSEVSSGYMFKDLVIRVAKVEVGNGN